MRHVPSYIPLRGFKIDRWYRIVAKKVVGKRYGPKNGVRDDMIGTFVQNGLDQREAESEILTIMCVYSESIILPVIWQCDKSLIP